MNKRKHAQTPVTVSFFTPPDHPAAAQYAPAPEKAVTVNYMAPEEADDCPWDFETTIPPGYVRKGDIVIACMPEVRTKYKPVTLDARTWTNRIHMYDALRRELGLTFEAGENLDSLEDEIAGCIYRITIVWSCVPAVHMRDYFERVLEIMYAYHALERVYGEDVRDEIEDWLEVDFAAGDTPARPFHNPPREYFEIPPLDEMW